MGDKMSSYEKLKNSLETMLDAKNNFDIISKQLLIDEVNISIFCIDGLVKDDLMEKILSSLLKEKIKESIAKQSIELFSSKYISYLEVTIEGNLSNATTAILSGSVALLIEGYEQLMIIDARQYPTRSMQEPEDDQVLRGSRDGFVETLVFNTALIRRRIRDTSLTMDYYCIGSKSKTDIVMCYMKGKADIKIVNEIKDKLNSLDVEALTMAQESIAEAMFPTKWINPLPKVRFSERPDTVASNILEGKVVLIVDSSPSVLILPTSFFDFVQEAQDYYLPPMTGNYLRIVRLLVIFFSMLFTPFWFYFNTNPTFCPEWFKFALLTEQVNIPVFIQLFLLEVGIDVIKLALLNTPGSLSGSLSLVGGLILGDFAVSSGWVDSKVLLYMAFVALANFVQPSFELTYAVKFTRMFLLIMIMLMPVYGLWIGLAIVIYLTITNKTITGNSYFYPLIPFNYYNLKKVLFRRKLMTKKEMSRNRN